VKHSSSLLSSPLPPPSLPVPENAKLLAWVGDEILPREMAKVCLKCGRKLNSSLFVDLHFEH